MTEKEMRNDPQFKKVLFSVTDNEIPEPLQQSILNVLLERVEKNGSCRVGWACEFILKDRPRYNIHDKIAGLATKSGQYIKERNKKHKDDWTIYNNPNYEFQEISKKTSIAQRKAIIFTVVIAAFTLLVQISTIIINATNQRKQRDLQEQQLNSSPPTILIDSVIVHQNGVKKSSAKDTTKTNFKNTAKPDSSK